MKLNKKILMKKRKGFTLIELVIVIAILGVLSSISLVKFGGIEEKSKLNADFITANNIATATKIAMNDENEENQDKSKIDINYLIEKKYLDSKPKVQSEKNKEFEIKLEDENVEVKVGEKIFYPKGLYKK